MSFVAFCMSAQVQFVMHVTFPRWVYVMGHRVVYPTQAGAWDVDDTGLEYMPSKAVAERIQKKVLSMYIRDTVISTGLLAAFCLWPL